MPTYVYATQFKGQQSIDGKKIENKILIERVSVRCSPELKFDSFSIQKNGRCFKHNT